MTEQPESTLDDIEMRLVAKLVHLPIVRSVAANIAMRTNFDVDAISDLEMAVDEACSTVITRAMPEATLTCRFGLGAEEITFTTTVVTEDEAPPSTSTFGWKVLTTLADTAATWIEADGEPPCQKQRQQGDGADDHGPRNRLYVELAKRRPVVAG